MGAALGSSDWLQLDQARIDQFADVTLDDQWIHTDPQRARTSIFGRTVAHGFLTLSLLPHLRRSAFDIEGIAMTVNYGLNRVRFPAPVPVGSRVRAHYRLASFEALEGAVQLVVEVSVERDGTSKPVCVAEWVSRHYR